MIRLENWTHIAALNILTGNVYDYELLSPGTFVTTAELRVFEPPRAVTVNGTEFLLGAPAP